MISSRPFDLAVGFFGAVLGMSPSPMLSAPPVSFDVPQRDFLAGKGPSSIVSGDLNGDGIPDLIVTNDLTNGFVTVLIGEGNGSFGSPMFYGVASNPLSLAIGDFNNDGRLDVITGNSISNSISFLAGSGDGTLQPAQTIAVGANANALQAADLNNDGNLDLLFASGNLASGNNVVTVLLGRGDGTFGNPSAIVLPDNVSSVSIAITDFNHDGIPDFATANFQRDSVTVALGRGDGSFGPINTISIPANPRFVITGDFNGDGNPDILACGGIGYSLQLGNGDGTFRNGTSGYNQNPHNGPASGDFNGDGNLDFAVTTAVGDMSIYLGDGSGAFEPAGTFPMYSSVLIARDFNGDGKLDLAGPSGASSDTISVLLNRGNAVFAEAPRFAAPVGATVSSFALGDVNGDGKLDLVTSDATPYLFGTNTVGVLLGNGSGRFQLQATFPADVEPISIQLADFNGDGNLDISTLNDYADDVSVLLGNGHGSFANPINTVLPAGIYDSLKAADLNSDGRPDLVAGATTGVVVLLGSGDGQFGQPILLDSYSSPILISDFNRDGKMDLAVSSDSGITILLGNGDGTFNVGQLLSGTLPQQIATGDFDGDGNPDLVAVVGTSLLVYFGNGQSFAASPVILSSPFQHVRSLTTADLDGDGRTDLVAAGLNTVAALVSDGDGTFSTPLFFDGGFGPIAVAAFDLNGDGRPDIITADPANVNVLLNKTK